jgi:hypothetical protein
MARKLRIQYPGTIYHVMNRGDRREAIFADDADRERLLEALTEACQETGRAASGLVAGGTNLTEAVPTDIGDGGCRGQANLWRTPTKTYIMAEYGEWNRKGATLSDVTAQKEFGVSRDFIVQGIQAWKLEFMSDSDMANLRDLVDTRRRPEAAQGLIYDDLINW